MKGEETTEAEGPGEGMVLVDPIAQEDATSEAPLFASGPDRLPEELSPPCLALTGSARLGRGSAADSEPLRGTARAAASPPLLRPEGSLAGFGRRSFRPSSSSFAGAGALLSAGRAGGSIGVEQEADLVCFAAQADQQCTRDIGMARKTPQHAVHVGHRIRV